MILTASFTEARKYLAAITDKVMKDRVQATVFKHNKPAFKIVSIETSADARLAYLSAASDLDDEFVDVFDALTPDSTR